MPPRSLHLALLFALAPACSADLLFLEAPPGLKSVIVVYPREGVLRADAQHAADRARVELPPEVADGASITALLYTRDLTELGLDPGPIPARAPSDFGRPLPIAELGAFRTAKGAGEWRALGPEEDDLDALRLPSDALRCVERGGCFAGDDQRCVAPCEDPGPPAPPAEPMVPASAAPPAAAAQVIMTPCRAGWTETASASDRPARCSPPPAPAPRVCPASEMRGYGEAACRAIGRACPAGEFAAPPAGAVVRYVRAGAGPAGDGSAGSPFATLARALALSPDGAVLLVGRGRHLMLATFDRDVTLLGACSAETVIEGDVAFAAAGLRVEDLTVAGAILVPAGADVALVGARVEGAGDRSVSIAAGSRARIEGSLIRGGIWAAGTIDLIGSASDQTSHAIEIVGPGVLTAERWATSRVTDTDLLVTAGGAAAVDRAELVGGAATSIAARAGTQVTLTDVVIGAATGPAIDAIETAEITARGLHAAERGGCVIGATGAHVSITDARLEGMLCARDGARLDVSRVHASGGRGVELAQATLSGGDLWIIATSGAGVEGLAGSAITLSRARIEQTDDAALRLIGATTTASIGDLFVRDVAAGIAAAGGARASIARLNLARAESGLASVLDPDTRVALTDVRASALNRGEARALLADRAARLVIVRARIDDAGGAGVQISGGSMVTLRDFALAHGGEPATPESSYCMRVEGTLDAERVSLKACRARAIQIANGGRARVTDLLVEDVSSGDAGTPFGVVVDIDGDLELDRARIMRVTGTGLKVAAGAKADMRDLDVQSTLADVAAPTVTLPGLRLDGETTLVRARVEDSATRAIGIEGNASERITIEDLTIRGAANQGIFISKAADVARARIEDTNAGILVTDGAGTTLVDLDVRASRGANPVGIRAVGPAELTIERFRVSEIRGPALAIAEPATKTGEALSLDLSRGVIDDADLLIEIGFEGYDLGRLLDRVLVRDVGQISTAGTARDPP